MFGIRETIASQFIFLACCNMTAKTCYCYCYCCCSCTIRLLHLAGPANELFSSYSLPLVFFQLGLVLPYIWLAKSCTARINFLIVSNPHVSTDSFYLTLSLLRYYTLSLWWSWDRKNELVTKVLLFCEPSPKLLRIWNLLKLTINKITNACYRTFLLETINYITCFGFDLMEEYIDKKGPCCRRHVLSGQR